MFIYIIKFNELPNRIFRLHNNRLPASACFWIQICAYYMYMHIYLARIIYSLHLAGFLWTTNDRQTNFGANFHRFRCAGGKGWVRGIYIFRKLTLFGQQFIIIIKLHSEIRSSVCIILHLFVAHDLIREKDGGGWGSAFLFFTAKLVGKVVLAWLVGIHVHRKFGGLFKSWIYGITQRNQLNDWFKLLKVGIQIIPENV